MINEVHDFLKTENEKVFFYKWFKSGEHWISSYNNHHSSRMESWGRVDSLFESIKTKKSLFLESYDRLVICFMDCIIYSSYRSLLGNGRCALIDRALSLVHCY